MMCGCGAPSARHRSRGDQRGGLGAGCTDRGGLPGLVEWTLPIEQLGPGARYYEYDPKEARRLLAEAGYAKGFKTQITVTNGLGRDRIDEAVLVQRYLKEVGIEAELKIQEHGAYTATTVQGKFEGLVDSPSGVVGNRMDGCIVPTRPTPPGTWATSMTPRLRPC